MKKPKSIIEVDMLPHDRGQLMDRNAASAYTGIGVTALGVRTFRGQEPQCYRIKGSWAVFYAKDDLDEFLESYVPA